MTRPRLLVTALISVALAGGCGTADVGLHRQAPSPPFPEPSGVTTPTEIPPEQTPDCNPRQSLRPLDPLPPPGEMPEGSTMAEIHKRGRLIVGIGSNAYLLASRDPYTGEIKGFEAELARAIAFAIFGEGSQIQFKTFDLDDRLQAVEKETVDIAATIMTCTLWQRVDFSVEYLDSGQRVLVLKDSTFNAIEGLGGRKVCAAAASEITLRAIANATSKPVPVGAANTTDCLLMLQQGQVDAVSTASTILAGLAAQDPATHIVGPPLNDAPIGIMISREHPDLVRFVNGVIEKLISDGTWQRLYQTWLYGQIGEASPPKPQYQPER